MLLRTDTFYMTNQKTFKKKSVLPCLLWYCTQETRYGNNLSVHQRIKKMWHIYNGILFSHEKKGNAVIYDNKDGP